VEFWMVTLCSHSQVSVGARLSTIVNVRKFNGRIRDIVTLTRDVVLSGPYTASVADHDYKGYRPIKLLLTQTLTITHQTTFF
jgi:hypothetical protein